MQIEIVGPNLPRPLCDQGEMHVHAAGCGHLKRSPLREQRDGIVQDMDSMQAVVESCYGPEAGSFYAESDIPEDEWDGAWENHGYVHEFHFAPCTADLPRYRPAPAPDAAEAFVASYARFGTAELASGDHPNYDGASDVAIDLLGAAGFEDGDEQDATGDPVANVVQTALMVAFIRAPELMNVLTPLLASRHLVAEAAGNDEIALRQQEYAVGFAHGIMAGQSRYQRLNDRARAELAGGFATFTAQDGRMITEAGWEAFENRLLDWRYATRG